MYLIASISLATATTCAVLWLLATSVSVPRVAQGGRITDELAANIRLLDNELRADQAPERAISTYIARLSGIRHNCTDLDKVYEESIPDQSVSKANLEILRATNETCDQLSKVARDSQRVYSELQQLMKMNTKVRLYQTLPGIARTIQSNDLRTIQRINEQALAFQDSDGFPSMIPEQFSALESSMSHSQGFEYLAPVAAFQKNTLAERQQYWSSYIGMSDLIRSLDTQVARYCQLEDVSRHMPSCGD